MQITEPSEIPFRISMLRQYAQNTGIADIRPALQALIDEYNVNAPAYKRIYSIKVRESELEKTASRKIKRS